MQGWDSAAQTLPPALATVSSLYSQWRGTGTHSVLCKMKNCWMEQSLKPESAQVQKPTPEFQCLCTGAIGHEGTEHLELVVTNLISCSLGIDVNRFQQQWDSGLSTFMQVPTCPTHFCFTQAVSCRARDHPASFI